MVEGASGQAVPSLTSLSTCPRRPGLAGRRHGPWYSRCLNQESNHGRSSGRLARASACCVAAHTATHAPAVPAPSPEMSFGNPGCHELGGTLHAVRREKGGNRAGPAAAAAVAVALLTPPRSRWKAT